MHMKGMKVLVVGGGGREHAIAEALHRSPGVELYSVMGRRNPGIARVAKEHLIERETAVSNIVRFALHREIEYVLIGPEAPLEAGIADHLEEAGISCIGPRLAAARLETDKAFCRDMMKRHGIAGCPHYRVFSDPEQAASFIAEYPGDLAIKPVGLTGGKGVRVMGEQLDRDGAISYVHRLGGNVVVEERLIGEEFTLQAFVDGRHLSWMPLVQDHKRAYEGDMGPNTGGMGSYSMADHTLPFVTERDLSVARKIMEDAVAALREQGQPYKGILYGQFMNARDGPVVIEFNARFGDPEAMNVLSILESDFSEIVVAIAAGDLKPGIARFAPSATVCKYLVPAGYPDSPQIGQHIDLPAYDDAILYYGSVTEENGHLVTQSSRTAAYVGIGPDLAGAERIAERAAASAAGPVRHRSDIGTAALLEKRIAHMKELR